ncbi:hypothetical protein KKF55_02045 [Patescibacteria group bacterium]|nr:hypothetical protein [Patescibacteria group bacterium]
MPISSPTQVPESLLELAEQLHGRSFDPSSTRIKEELSIFEPDDSGDRVGDCLSVILEDNEGEYRVLACRHFFEDKCNMILDYNS